MSTESDGPDQLDLMPHVPDRIGDWRVIDYIGSGGFGIVLLVEHHAPAELLQTEFAKLRPVRMALKIIKDTLADPRSERRFAREVSVLTELHYDCVARVLHFGAADVNGQRRLFYVMEYVQGQNLREYLNGKPLRTQVELFARVCDAVASLHEHDPPVIHKDLKPQNILVRDDGTVKIIDFGLAKMLGDRSSAFGSVTETGARPGTWQYMSPEQLSGRTESELLDVYSLGVIFYEILSSGELPYPGEGLPSPEILFDAIRQAPRVSLRARKVPIAAELDCIVMRALLADPRQRYASVKDLAQDLRSFLSGGVIMAALHRQSLSYKWYRVKSWFAAHPRMASLLAATVVALISVTFWLATTTRRADDRERAQVSTDGETLKKLISTTLDLLPPVPGSVPKMKAWLAEIDGLRPRLDQHRTYALGLAQRSIDASARSREIDALATPGQRAELDNLCSRVDLLEREMKVAQSRMEQDVPLQLANRRDEIAEVRSKIATLEWTIRRDALHFASDDDTKLYAQITDLVRALESFLDPDGQPQQVQTWLSDADSVRARSIDQHRPEWEHAVVDIEDDPQYQGLQLMPQLGLVPLGKDPVSHLWEFGHVLSGSLPTRNTAGGLQFDASSCVVLVLIPPGDYGIGTQAAGTNEMLKAVPRTIHEDAFFISKYEMTQAQWVRCMERNTSKHRAQADLPSSLVSLLHPAEGMTWYEADKAARRLGLQLPTQEQWEVAARADSPTPWWTGDEEESLARQENIADQSLKRLRKGRAQSLDVQFASWDDKYPMTAPVGTFASNPWGLSDVLGNVSEWCAGSISSDGEHPNTDRKLGSAGAFRGGNYTTSAMLSQAGIEGQVARDQQWGELGIRFVRAVETTDWTNAEK